jgi:Protein of unknown function (DUF3365)
MNTRGFLFGFAVGTVCTCLLAPWLLSAASKEQDSSRSIPAERVADYVHSVIQADRTIYTTEVVERMQMRGIVTASENWRETWRLPLPAQFLIEAGRLVAEQPNGIRYRLISNWAINKKNRPITEFERTGLTEILSNPDFPYKGVRTEDGIRYFNALYPDKAVSQTCIGCHNAHPDSPKRDFKMRDIMGGLLLSIPLSQ